MAFTFVHAADSHLGYEVTKMAQCDPEGRRGRAEAVYRNFQATVLHALEIEADLFIHSGDLFNKYDVPRFKIDSLVDPMIDLARAGTMVMITPGNHERSELPFDLFHGTKGIFVFDRPKSLSLNLRGYRVGVAGFPFIRGDSRLVFSRALEETECECLRSDLNILVTHQAFDEASVGPANFTFRTTRPDTVARREIPLHFQYVAAGHIHRYQVLPHPLKPRVKVVYPGSTRRISFAEMSEQKGFVEGEFLDDRIETRFTPLQAFPMEIVELQASGMNAGDCEQAIMREAWRFSEDLVIRFNLVGGERLDDYPNLTFQKLRARMPKVLELQFAIRSGKRWIMR